MAFVSDSQVDISLCNLEENIFRVIKTSENLLTEKTSIENERKDQRQNSSPKILDKFSPKVKQKQQSKEGSVTKSPKLSARLKSSLSPKTRAKSEGLAKKESNSASSSPTAAARKYFKVLSSWRRGSEPPPATDHGVSGIDFRQIQMGVTDRRWQKLRAILEDMRDAPVEEGVLLKGQTEILDETSSLHTELSILHDRLKQQQLDLQQMQDERDSALSYIRKNTLQKDLFSIELKHNQDESTWFFEADIDDLRKGTTSKIDECGSLPRSLDVRRD